MNSSEKNRSGPPSELQENLEILRETYFFSGLPLETLKVFAYLCTRVKFKQGEYIFRQNEDDGRAFYIISGKARLERADNSTTKEIRDCRTGEFLGGLTLLGEVRRLFSLKAVQDTVCLILNRDKFSKALEQFPDIMPRIFKAVAKNIDAWEERFLADRADSCGECIVNLGVSLI
ncbi:MAG: cyclic nucleotide-binding domain-containing protein [Desulfobacterales bacterium]|jgi:CRP-like cAMP-binding protein|nr:cyclic nucleotide-binding domain-containing protein [Desulfobacterales bacterium]